MSSIPTPTIPLQLSAASVDELKGLGEMLQRIFVRNKNQHRRSHWWKALKGFKRELGLVLGELAALQATTNTSTSTSNSKPALTRRLEARLRVLGEEKMHAWYMTFTQLVAAGQFAPVGLVLMAAAARAAKLLGVTDVYEVLNNGSSNSSKVNATRGEKVPTLKAARMHACTQTVKQPGLPEAHMYLTRTTSLIKGRAWFEKPPAHRIPSFAYQTRFWVETRSPSRVRSGDHPTKTSCESVSTM